MIKARTATAPPLALFALPVVLISHRLDPEPAAGPKGELQSLVQNRDLPASLPAGAGRGAAEASEQPGPPARSKPDPGILPEWGAAEIRPFAASLYRAEQAMRPASFPQYCWAVGCLKGRSAPRTASINLSPCCTAALSKTSSESPPQAAAQHPLHRSHVRITPSRRRQVTAC